MTVQRPATASPRPKPRQCLSGEAVSSRDVAAQFSPLPPTTNTTAPVVAAVFGGLVVAGLALLLILQMRRREAQPAPEATPLRQPATG